MVVSSTSTASADTGTASTTPGNIDIETDPDDTTGDVEFSPASGGTTLIDAATITLDEQQYDGPVQLDNNATFDSTTSTTFGSTVDGAVALTLEGPSTTFSGPVGGTAAPTSLTAEGPVHMSGTGGQITTLGAQDYEATWSWTPRRASSSNGIGRHHFRIDAHRPRVLVHDHQDAGSLSVSEAAGRTKLATSKLTSNGSTTLHVRLKLTAKVRKKLGKRGLEAILTVTFTPTGAQARTLKHSGIRLKR